MWSRVVQWTFIRIQDSPDLDLIWSSLHGIPDKWLWHHDWRLIILDGMLRTLDHGCLSTSSDKCIGKLGRFIVTSKDASAGIKTLL